GAFIEGAYGCGAPVAIAGAFMIGLGFKPFHAAALNLIANTEPVAWEAIGTPVHTLAAVTSLPESDLNAMIGRILPFTAIIVPFWLVRTMVSWKETFEVFPVILVVGISFALTQFFWSNYVDSNLVDIMAGVVSIVAVLIFLQFWKPKKTWRFDYDDKAPVRTAASTEIVDQVGGEWAAGQFDASVNVRRYTTAQVLRAWTRCWVWHSRVPDGCIHSLGHSWAGWGLRSPAATLPPMRFLAVCRELLLNNSASIRS